MRQSRWALGVLAFLLLSSFSAPACAQDLDWVLQFGSTRVDEARAAAVDADGNAYVVGFTTGILPGQTFAGAKDVFIRKLDTAGAEVWTRQFGTTTTEEARAVCVVGSEVYVAGFTYGVLPGQVAAGGTDAFLRKYDTSGNEFWTRQFGTNSTDDVYGIAADTSGLYVSGETQGTLPGQVSAGSRDAFLRKYDYNGNELWTRQFGTSTIDGAARVAADASGIYVAGDTLGAFPGQVARGSLDIFVRKFDAAGIELWTTQFGTTSIDNTGCVSTDTSGVYVAGSTGGAMPGFVAAGSYDAFVWKGDDSGSEMWCVQFGTPSSDQAFAVAADSSGAYVAGATSGSLGGAMSSGASDVFVRKLGPHGSEDWTTQFGSASSDRALGAGMGASGLYVVGSTFGVLGGPAAFTASAAGGGSGDACVARFGLNQAPVAQVSVTQLASLAVGALYECDGSGSSDPDHTIDDLTFRWSVDGVIGCEGPASSCAVIQIPLGFGAHDVTLRVTDPLGAFDEETVSVTVDQSLLSVLDIDDVQVKFASNPPRAKIKGTVGLPAGVDFRTMSPEAVVELALGGSVVAGPQQVDFEVRGRYGRRWRFRDCSAATGTRKLDIYWKSAKYKFRETGFPVRLSSCQITSAETRLVVRLRPCQITGPFSIDVGGHALVTFDSAGGVVSSTCPYETVRAGRKYVLVLPFALDETMTILLAGSISRSLAVSDGLKPGGGRFRMELRFDGALLPNGVQTLPRTLDLSLSLGSEALLGIDSLGESDLLIQGNKWKTQ